MSEPCVKCGADDIVTRWHHCHRECLYGEEAGGYRDREHLHDHCRTCGYHWARPCLDAAVPPAAPGWVEPAGDVVR